MTPSGTGGGGWSGFCEFDFDIAGSSVKIHAVPDENSETFTPLFLAVSAVAERFFGKGFLCDNFSILFQFDDKAVVFLKPGAMVPGR